MLRLTQGIGAGIAMAGGSVSNSDLIQSGLALIVAALVVELIMKGQRDAS